MKCGILVAVLLITVRPSFADSITFNTFALQQGGGGVVRVPLGPGLDPLLVPGVSGVLTFGTFFGPIGTAMFSATINLPGLHSTQGPFTDVCNDPTGCIETSGWAVPPSYTVTPATLSVTLNGVTATDDFRYQSPVPEPTAVALLGAGLMAVLWRKYSARQFKGRAVGGQSPKFV
jgi:PEP-CTERM motif-containing protein